MGKERAEAPVATLQNVLNEFVLAEEHPTRAALGIWVRQYPQFERELAEFMAVWMAEETLPEPVVLASEDEDLIINRAMSQVENLLYQRGGSDAPAVVSTTAAPLTSLIQSARTISVDVPALAAACQLDRTLLVKLEAHLILASSIPAQLIEKLTQVLKRSAQEIAAFLEQPPRIVPGTSFLAHDTPRVSPQETFADAVQKSALPKALKDYWLAESARHDPPS
jgi:hypothetical protein